MVTLADCAVEDTEVGDNATEGVEHRVEDEGLEWRVLITLGCGNTLNDSLEDILNALTRLTRCQENILILAADKVDNLILHLVSHRRLAVNLVEHGDNLEVLTKCEVEVRDCLCLNALCGIHNEECTLT